MLILTGLVLLQILELLGRENKTISSWYKIVLATLDKHEKRLVKHNSRTLDIHCTILPFGAIE